MSSLPFKVEYPVDGVYIEGIGGDTINSVRRNAHHAAISEDVYGLLE